MREPRGTRALGGDEGTENSLSAACGHSEKPGPPTRKWASPRCQPRRPPWHPVTTGQATAPRAQTVHGQASQGDPGGTEGTHSWLRRSRPPAEGREEDPGGKAAAAAAQSSQTKRTSAAPGTPERPRHSPRQLPAPGGKPSTARRPPPQRTHVERRALEAGARAGRGTAPWQI